MKKMRFSNVYSKQVDCKNGPQITKPLKNSKLKMEPYKTNYLLPSSTSLGSVTPSTIVEQILEEHIPQLQDRKVEYSKKIYSILLYAHNPEYRLNVFLKQLQEEFTFNLQIVKILFMGIQFYLDSNKFQTIKELDLFLEAKKEDFGQILLDGFQEKSADHVANQQGAK